MYILGIDIGSITSKAVLLNKDNEIESEEIIFTGYSSEKAGEGLLSKILDNTSIKREEIVKVVSTGYGRKSISFADRAVSEIICHAVGAYFMDPAIRTVIDIGGQDSKVISVGEDGKVGNFVMNDKCSAGTGRFLEVMARALELDLSSFGELSLKGKSPPNISSICTVFAESEVISLISKGENRENIISGIHRSVAQRIYAMLKKNGYREPVAITGGVARNIGVVKAIEEISNISLLVPEKPQLNGAIGAAIIGIRSKNFT